MKLVRKLSLLIAAIAPLALATGARAALVHEYTFSSSGTATDSAGAAHGTLFGGATIAGGILSLNGTSAYVETTGFHIIPTSGPFTLSFDARAPSISGTYAEMISQGSSGSGFYVGYAPGGTDMRLSDSALSTGVPFPSDGGWHTYLVSSSALITEFFIDSVLKYSMPAIVRGPGGTDTRFGSQFSSFGEFFAGDLDNIRVYDTDLAGITNEAVPEPSTIIILAMAMLSLLGLGIARRYAPTSRARMPS